DINRAQLRNGPRQVIDARRKRASQSLSELPSRKRLYGSIAKNVRAGGIENRILHSGRQRQIYIASAYQVLSMHVRVGDIGNNAVCNLALDRQAGLMYLRSSKISRERGNVAADKSLKIGRSCAGTGQRRAIDQRQRILREDLLGVE